MKKMHVFVFFACIAAVTACNRSRDRDNSTTGGSVMDRSSTTTYEQPGQMGHDTTDQGSQTIETKKVTTETVKERIPTVEEKHVKADINRMSADEFQKLGLSKSVAENVTKYRSEHGEFRSIDDLRNVPGMNQG